MKLIYQILTVIMLLQGCSLKKNTFTQENNSCPKCYVTLKKADMEIEF